MPEFNVLESVSAGDLDLDPYAHLVRTPALAEPVYQQLAREFPKQDSILRGRVDKIGNAAARLPAFKVIDNADVTSAWREFFAFHTSPEFWGEIVRVFGAQLRAAFPGIEARVGRSLEEWRAGPRGVKDDGDIRLDCQCVVNTPPRRPSSVKTAHVDRRSTILSMLLYFRDPADECVGGDLELFAWRRAPRFLLPQRLILPQDLELRRTVRYAPNTLAAFVNYTEAAHGVSVRTKAKLPRRYINFIAETPFKAFPTPELGLAQRLIHWPQIRQLEIRALPGDRY